MELVAFPTNPESLKLVEFEGRLTFPGMLPFLLMLVVVIVVVELIELLLLGNVIFEKVFWLLLLLAVKLVPGMIEPLLEEFAVKLPPLIKFELLIFVELIFVVVVVEVVVVFVMVVVLLDVPLLLLLVILSTVEEEALNTGKIIGQYWSACLLISSRYMFSTCN